VHIVYRSYKFGDEVFLRVRPQKISIKFGKGVKLSPQYVEPFEILERKAFVSYCLSFPSSLDCMHDVFHVPVLHHYISYPSHVIDLIHL